MRIWEGKIGEVDSADLPKASDLPEIRESCGVCGKVNPLSWIQLYMPVTR